MNGVGLSHPDREQLAAFGLGRLDETAAATVQEHLEDCTLCRTILENLPADSFVAKLQANASTESVVPQEAPTLTNAILPLAGDPGVPPELAQHPRYRVLELLGIGGMGVVYKAEHLLMGRLVALKVINRALTGDPAAIERFRREVRSAAQLVHPHIVTAYDAEQAGDIHFLVMEYVEGDSLDRLVKRQGPLPIPLACDCVRQAALGLQYAFQHGMVHRDIKPANLIRTPEGQIKILDFGLARLARDSAPAAGAPAAGGFATPAPGLTQAGAMLGTPDYMAPEQAASPQSADIRADIYSLGCTLYYLVTGQPPFPTGDAIDKLIAHAERTPPPLTQFRLDAPPELVRIVERMLAKDPAQRYPTPADVVHALDARGNAAEEPALPQNAGGPPRRHWRLVASMCAACGGLILVSALIVLIQRGREETLNDQLTMLYSVCAVMGGTVLVCQFLLGLLGLGHHGDGIDGHDLGGEPGHAEDVHDPNHDAHATGFVRLLTVRTFIAAVAFFGLGGRAADAAGFQPAQTLALALAAGGGALLLVAWLMRVLVSLQSDGSVRIRRAVGRAGTVYLPIPGHKAGLGKVLLNVQNRTMEYQAVTAEDTLETGSKVVVVAVLGTDTVEVILAPTAENVSHV
ncbi:MAG TPA: serine/threonine-protein kinase [Gemmataceae bacterium]|nr:serine/threonine-protein kinase [Gemmataceae bacterium]